MNKVPKVVKPRKKRVGRGFGSGKGGHTVGRGQKGQKSRRKIHVLFEGLKVKKSLLRRLPLQRGKAKFKPKPKPIVVNLEYLNLVKDGAKVDIACLVKAGIVRQREASQYGVKILGRGKLKKKLNVYLPTSKSAAKAIEKAGGKVIKSQ